MNVNLFLKRNGSIILTVLGGVGVVATAVTAVKATPKAIKLIEVYEEQKGENLTMLEKVKVAGPNYIPAILIGVGTIACIFGANVLNKRTQASLMSAYALIDNSYKEYKKKVAELYGDEMHKEVISSIAKDKYTDDINVSDDKQLFYDEFSHRYFESTLEDVIKAEYNTNRQLQCNGVVYLNEYYEFLGLEPSPVGTDLGWSSGILESHYCTEHIEFDHGKVILDDCLECCIITLRYEPVIDFEYY